ncbi:dUTP diphosphatase [Fructilactobacillus lindneri]|uniref:dUTP diphosphatase n=2 Tax=Fructilactobacillus lindneri TaxID=53444 RepID=A0A0R2JQF1_9LACO|nr:dUTP diphosphatase [Fructilactobacillus lindneri]ANZ57307.1 dUTP diphosphatase [Fructilactobacillus lindneri]ANZ58572.1 dUTP diphosphatase [Fructilactobacillus lindneri]KRN79342.1 Deoxyuridine 5-triphosphate nucleotidohydrolase [Fructilactobacillus lindneri DSM 20690 = JCM 11027]POG98387.1 dUTP diphosphatase [Fructilactobacillus lindneri]POH03786.1 dUTP diphosphatase [Fructilactobacillus lindneri]
MQRGFKVISKAVDSGIELPKRATENAAGYDFASSVDMVLPSIWKIGFLKALKIIQTNRHLDEVESETAQKVLKPYLIPTGIKAYMQPNEVLIIANRSSNPLKRGMIIPNGIGVIDADYYDNENNEGEIFVQMVNFGIKDRKIKKGERIGQGIFMPYLLADDETAPKAKRTGGFGSSGK